MIQEFSPESIALASDLISRGELVAFPVEHGYAIACEPFLPNAISKLQQARGVSNVAIPVFIGKRNALDGLAAPVSPELKELLIGAWPGLLTVILKSAVPWDLGAGSGALISIRQPLSPIALALAQLHGPIAATSASKVGMTALTAIEVDEQLSPSLIIDGGPRPEGLGSTLLHCQGSRAAIVREGAVAASEISRLAPSLTLVEPDALL